MLCLNRFEKRDFRMLQKLLRSDVGKVQVCVYYAISAVIMLLLLLCLLLCTLLESWLEPISSSAQTFLHVHSPSKAP